MVSSGQGRELKGYCTLLASDAQNDITKCFAAYQL